MRKYKLVLKRKVRVIVNSQRFSNSERHATGITYFKSSGYHSGEWVDGKTPLNEQIPAILAKLEMSVDELHKIQEGFRLSLKMQEDEENNIKAIQERKEKELIEFKILLGKAIRSHQAGLIRNYIAEVKKTESISDSNLLTLQTWLVWAKDKADWYDPLVDAEDELLKEVDKETLRFKKNED